MKKLIDNIKNIKLIKEFNIIDSTIICESLQCQLLQDLAKQLLDIKGEHQKYLDDEYEKDIARGWSSWKSSNNCQNFKQIFGKLTIAWDKITDKDISKIPATEETDKKIDKQIRDVLKGKSQYLILIRDKEDKEFLYFIDNWTSVIQLNKRGTTSLPGGKLHSYIGRQPKDLTQSQKINLCRGKNIYFIDYSKYQGDASQKQIDRRQEKNGMVYLDPESLKRLAENNIKRYKEIIRKNKANNLNNNELLNKAKQIIQQAATYATMVAKDPVRHADLIGDVSKLSTWIYDKQRYIPGTSVKNPGYYSGVNGLLPIVMSYTKVVADLAKTGGYEHQQKEFENLVQSMKKAISEAEKMINEIERKIDE